ncbi:MAG: helix-turn-helix domain-containing protein [Treponema sp.]|nr:helix-turn-helix domain-containing protein [Treponema sp.]
MSTETENHGLEIRRIFARNLRRLRESQNISQLELSTKTGLTHNFINDIENCRKWVSPETLAKFAGALRVQPFQFFLSEFLADQYEQDPFSVYREDFVDMFQKMAAEWMSVYLPKDREN